MARAPRPCAFCGEPINGGRSDKRFCSPKCRASAARRRADPPEVATGAVTDQVVLDGPPVTVEELRQHVIASEASLIGVALHEAVRRKSWPAARWLLGWAREGGGSASPAAPIDVLDEMDELHAQRASRGDATWFPGEDEPQLDELAARRRRQAGLP